MYNLEMSKKIWSSRGIYTKYTSNRPHIYCSWVMGRTQKDFRSSIPQSQYLETAMTQSLIIYLLITLLSSIKNKHDCYIFTSWVYFLIGTVNARASPRSAILSIIVFRSIKRLWGFRSLTIITNTKNISNWFHPIDHPNKKSPIWGNYLCKIPWPWQKATPLQSWNIKLCITIK